MVAPNSPQEHTPGDSLTVFAERLNVWLDENGSLAPPEASYVDRPVGPRDAAADGRAAMRAWSAALADAGFAAPGVAGSAVDPGGWLAEALVHDTLAARGLPAHLGALGVAVVGRVLVAHGSERQRAAQLEALGRGEALWCIGRTAQAAIDGAGRLVGRVHPVGPAAADRLLLDAGGAVVVVSLDQALVTPAGEVEFDGVQLGDDALLGAGATAVVRDLETCVARHALATGRARLAALSRELAQLAHDRGATATQRVRLAATHTRAETYRIGAWTALADPQGALDSHLAIGLHRLERELVALALELLGAEGFLAPPNAPYGGVWSRRDAALGRQSLVQLVNAWAVDPLAAADLPFQRALRSSAREALGGEPDLHTLAALGWTGAAVAEDAGGAALSLADEGVLHTEAGRALLDAPLWASSRLAPFLPTADQQALAAGDASWTLAEEPLVPNAAQTTHVAVLGGDGVWELTGASVEELPTVVGARPLGVVVGGEVTRRLFPTELLPHLRRRSLLLLGYEALGVGSAALARLADSGVGGDAASALLRPVVAAAIGDLVAARARLDHEAGLSAGTAEAAALAKIVAAQAALDACRLATEAAQALPDRNLAALETRARWLLQSEAPPTQVLDDLAAELLGD